MKEFSSNPYQSPPSCELDVRSGHPHLGCVLTKWRWVYRRFELNGQSDAVIEYNGRGVGYETVFVNGVVAIRVSSPGISFSTPIDFVVPMGADSSAHARFEIRTRALLFLGAFRLFIDGYVVYSEGEW
ncbi:MAG: hypothetical protein H8E66_26485 [Planctomycetes bacterium]|nr:hypothetical protein [Planctomycetota bacterium]